MADNLSKIFGTEKDRVNCPFFFKMGACRHGEACTRLHHKPTFSQTLTIIAFYRSPVEDLRDQSGPRKTGQGSKDQLQKHFEHFYEDIFLELSTYGEIEDLHVVDNLGEHMVGNVYCKFKREESADAAQRGMLGRFYSGQPITAELSPVTDFREARCRQYEEAKCSRGGYCNFMHIKAINRDLRRKLWDEQAERFNEARKRRREKRLLEEKTEREQVIEKSQSGSRDRSPGERKEQKEKKEKRDRSRSKSPKREKKESKSERAPEESQTSAPIDMWKCVSCGGWGRELVAFEGAMCDHCQRQK